MKKKTNIVVGICSCHGTGDKRKAVRSTWLAHPAQNVECMFFVGGNRVPEGKKKIRWGLMRPMATTSSRKSEILLSLRAGELRI